MPTELLGLPLDHLRRLAEAWGQPPYRGNQLYHALYVEKKLDFDQMSNLPQPFRAKLQQEATATLPAIEKRYLSTDGTIRYLLRLADGQTVETVWMPEDDLPRTERPAIPLHELPPAQSASSVRGRHTLCLSTQAGCAVDCSFCATARLGLLRNLSSGEIVGQVLAALEDNRQQLRPQTNIVLMGQGEPLLNYDATLQAVCLLADPDGMAIPQRRLTLSTSGILPGIRRLAQEEVRPKLALSLNATTDDQRDALMPVNRKYPIADLLQACREFPLRPWERLTFEYVLLGGLTDTPADAERLPKLLHGLRAKINLIPWNPVPSMPYRAPEPHRASEFQATLRKAGLLAFIRQPRGQDIFAACGQLATLEPAATPSPPPPR
jgi:23S rRNA (adenine2503-C2)-methyltransferase